MNQPLQAARSAAWMALAAVVAFFAVRSFLQNILPVSSGNSRIAAAAVAATAAALIAFPRRSLGRALLALASLTAVSFCISYDVVDRFLDPKIKPDWPLPIVAMVPVLWLLPIFAILVFRKE